MACRKHGRLPSVLYLISNVNGLEIAMVKSDTSVLYVRKVGQLGQSNVHLRDGDASTATYPKNC